MRTCVVVLGEQGEPDVPPLPDSGVVLSSVRDEGGLARTLDEGRHVLVLTEERHTVALARQSSLLAARGDNVPLATRALPHGPLAVRLLAEYAADEDVSPALAVALLDEVATETFSAAWVSSVARLSSPAPSLGQHLRSWLPAGSGFLIEHAPRSRVSAVGGRAAGEPRERSAGRAVLFVAGNDAPDAAVRYAQRLAGTLAHRRVPDAVVVSNGRYGATRAVQFAALPAELPEPYRTDLPSCPVCEIPVPQEACPFCHICVASPALEPS